jgi:protein involved in polysaccharide export with SLBB domain
MTRLATVLVIVAAASFSGGCAALTNPVADGVPVRRLPAEVLGRPKSEMQPVPLTLLRQKEIDPYRLDKGDVLAIVADEVIAPAGTQAPVRLPDPTDDTAAVGFPVPVNEDGTISLPRMNPLPVKGKTLAEVERLVRDAVTGKLPGYPELVKNPRVTVQILQKRRYQVLVVREDTLGNFIPYQAQPGQPVLGGNKKGSGYTLNLQAGENDVLRALNATGGPPGLDARNEVVILRATPGTGIPVDPNCSPEEMARRIAAGTAIRIPLRVYPDQPLTIREEDIMLKDGDILLIEARDTEVYYTAGIIGGGQYPLPRDYDLDIIQAIAQVRGPLINGSFSQNAFVAQAVNTGIGNPNPSLCTVLRQLPDRRQLPIVVDINRAFIDPRERLLILPGDIIVLQERPGEAFARYLTQTIRFNTIVESVRSGSWTQTIVGNNP